MAEENVAVIIGNAQNELRAASDERGIATFTTQIVTKANEIAISVRKNTSVRNNLDLFKKPLGWSDGSIKNRSMPYSSLQNVVQ